MTARRVLELAEAGNLPVVVPKEEAELLRLCMELIAEGDLEGFVAGPAGQPNAIVRPRITEQGRQKLKTS